jgi:acyl carrier protein
LFPLARFSGFWLSWPPHRSKTFVAQGKTVIRATIEKLFSEVHADQVGGRCPDLSDDQVLLDSGVDSLGFAILVARLEEELGFDPFSESDQPYYPKTFGEFVDFYEKDRR